MMAELLLTIIFIKAAFDVKVAKKMFLPSINLNEMIGFESLIKNFLT